MSRRRGILSCLAIILASITASVVMVACGEDEEISPSEFAEADVKQCIKEGGTPVFTESQYGTVIQYLGCIQP